MTDLIFVDTNVVLYTLGEDERKKAIARNVLAKHPVLSSQVINEAVNVCLRRFKFTREQAYAFADMVMRRTDVQAVDEMTIRKSAEIALRYQFSNWDSLIIAAALLAKCDILYSEDMQHNQVIDGQLTILNPFY
ncbi:MAG: PIN domain-containing protein [Methylococcales bacterium]|nr:PIN domain-containing protein [Methylococcales bacterium]